MTLVAVPVVAISGLWLWYDQSHNLQNKSSSTPATSREGISLTQSIPDDNNSSALRVDSNFMANNTGQLGANTDDNTTSSNTPRSLDPSTFSEYEKYKDEGAALFADMQTGRGDELIAGKKAAVYYKGWLTNGTLFDETKADDKGKIQPFIFEMGVQQVIPGWEQGLMGMKVGGTRLIIVPPSVGYGPNGQDQIPGGAVLIFQVQLLAVQ